MALASVGAAPASANTLAFSGAPAMNAMAPNSTTSLDDDHRLLGEHPDQPEQHPPRARETAEQGGPRVRIGEPATDHHAHDAPEPEPEQHGGHPSLLDSRDLGEQRRDVAERADHGRLVQRRGTQREPQPPRRNAASSSRHRPRRALRAARHRCSTRRARARQPPDRPEVARQPNCWPTSVPSGTPARWRPSDRPEARRASGPAGARPPSTRRPRPRPPRTSPSRAP